MKIKGLIITISLTITISCGTKKSTDKSDTRLNEIVLVNSSGQRCEVGQMINLISQTDPKAIGINFLYIDERTDHCDTILRQAITNFSKVILVEGFEGGKHVTSNESFLNVAMLSGPTGLSKDENEVTDTYYRLIDHQGKWEYSFPFHLALQYDPTRNSELAAKSSRMDYPIKFYYSADNFTVIDGLKGVQDNMEIFKGKIVIIGSMGQAVDNIFKTPVTEKSFDKSFGTVIIANVVLDILKDLDTESGPLNKYTEFIKEQQRTKNKD